MSARRFLIVGSAKTGTTVISHTLMNAAGLRHYLLEPQTVEAFEEPVPVGGQVVKILFPQWADRLETLDAIIDGRIGSGFTDVLFILRDPRATEVSALLYSPYNHFLVSQWSDVDAEIILEVFRRKEADPAGISLHAMIQALHQIMTGQNSQLLRGDEALKAFANIPTPASEVTTPYAEYIARRTASPSEILKYEDFVAGQLDDHPLANLLSGPRKVPNYLQRTRRTAGTDDWTAFLTPLDLNKFNRVHAPALKAFNYPLEVALGGAIQPEYCSLYVQKILAEAKALKDSIT